MPFGTGGRGDADMRDAETVTFAAAGLDRAAHLRDDAAALAGLAVSGDRLALWRGKVLVGPGGDLVRLPAGHAALDQAGLTVFLGLDAGRAIFASDISTWEPEGPGVETSVFLDPSLQQHPALPAGEVFAELRAVMARLTPREAELACSARAILQWHKSHGFCAACGQPSVPVKAGWQRDCPACGTPHFPRTDPVVIMLVTRGNALLVGRSPGWPEGMYSCLAGFMEPGETVEAAVRREVAEETGVPIGAVRYLSSQPWPFPSSLMIGCHAEALGQEIRLDPAELEDARWVSREEMVTVFAGSHPAIKPSRRGAIARFLIENWLADRLD